MHPYSNYLGPARWSRSLSSDAQIFCFPTTAYSFSRVDIGAFPSQLSLGLPKLVSLVSNVHHMVCFAFYLLVFISSNAENVSFNLQDLPIHLVTAKLHV